MKRLLAGALLKWVVPAAAAVGLIWMSGAYELRANQQAWALRQLMGMARRPPPRPDSRIVVVALDDASLADSRLPKWGPSTLDRRSHIRLIRELETAGAAVIGLDINFVDPSDDRFTDLELARQMSASGNVVLTLGATANAAAVGAESRFIDPPAPYLDAPNLKTASPLIRRERATGTALGIEIDQVDLSGVRVPAFAQEICQVYRERGGQWPAPPVRDLGDVLIGLRWPAEPANGAFLTVPYREIWDGSWLKAHTDGLRGKIALVGRVSPTQSDDAHRTPVGTVPGVFVHAVAVQTLLDDASPLNGQRERALTMVMAALAFLLVTAITYRFPPFWGLLVSLGACVIAWRISLWALAATPSTWIDPVPATLAVGAALVWRFTLERLGARRALGRFVDPAVVDELVNRGQISQRQVDATVFFTDVRNYTTLSERLRPEDVLDTLNIHFGWMDQIIRRHGGQVNKHTGDALMALFIDGGKSHASGAVAAAREMVETADTRAGAARQLGFGIGIHSGPVALGSLGASKAEYAAIGDTVNVAARLESATKEMGVQVLVSEATAQLVSEPLRGLGSLALKGKTEEIGVFTVV